MNSQPNKKNYESPTAVIVDGMQRADMMERDTHHIFTYLLTPLKNKEIMKKIHSFLMAAVLVAGSLTSCSSSDDMESKASALTPSDKEIKFTVGDITRGTAFTGDATALGAAGYQVFAYTHESPTKYIDRVVYPGGTAYWPTTGSLDFLALYPKTLTASQVNPTAWNVFSYTAPTAIDDQVDLMAATATDKNSASGDVALAFSHLLSQISIQAKAATNLTVTIKSVELHNVKTTGTFDGTALNEGEDKANYAISFDEKTLDADGAVADLTGSKVLLLVPQTTTAWPTEAGSAVSIAYNDGESGSKGSYIKVELKVKNGDSFVLGAAESYATVYFPLAINWTAQKHYTYTLTFGDSSSPSDGFGYKDTVDGEDGSGNPEDAEPTGVTQIRYNVTVSPWTDIDPTPVIF